MSGNTSDCHPFLGPSSGYILSNKQELLLPRVCVCVCVGSTIRGCHKQNTEPKVEVTHMSRLVSSPVLPGWVSGSAS